MTDLLVNFSASGFIQWESISVTSQSTTLCMNYENRFDLPLSIKGRLC
ncbi:hypothetical protein NMYAN_40033 [Nitrosomonas nitrosa]|uniref:Uncharacterized protein n=1 Tax=Nitrosomonas nitrosa TaxID=52442 RepID=A0A8H9DC18_9PROT|nr:hypothetical protein NMYAN_40033 [Nitrosomonas nitrosa]